jgi:hypothetical protein
MVPGPGRQTTGARFSLPIGNHRAAARGAGRTLGCRSRVMTAFVVALWAACRVSGARTRLQRLSSGYRPRRVLTDLVSAAVACRATATIRRLAGRARPRDPARISGASAATAAGQTRSGGPRCQLCGCSFARRSSAGSQSSTYWSGQDGGLVAQHKELDRLGPDERHDREQPEDLPEDHIQQPQRLAGIMSDR